jgi:hypothetical protein
MRTTQTRRASTRRHMWAPCLGAAVALTLTTCGCGSSGATPESSSAAAPTTSSVSTEVSTASSSTTSNTVSGGATPPGTQLAPGASALVNYKPGINANSPTYRLQVSVLAIKQGSQADMSGVELEKSQQGQTPYYVKLRIRNMGPGDASAEDGVPAAAFQAIDDRGEQGQELTVLGTFRPCESSTQPKHFTQGVTYNTCVIYLVGRGGSIVQEQWTGSADAYAEKPIVWKAD